MTRPMPVARKRTALRIVAGAVVALCGLAAAGCQAGPAPELSQQAVCLQHYENDPVERERCRLDPTVARGSPPDISPKELPVRSGQMSE